MPKRQRRTKGDGGLYRRADGRWCGVVELPAEPGKRRRKVVTARTQEEARRKMRDAQAAMRAAGDLSTSSPTLSAWLDLWYRTVAEPKVKPSTARTYRTYLTNYLQPAIGKVRLEHLSADHVIRLHAFIRERGLSDTTVRQAHLILRKALKDAVRQNRTVRNAADAVDPPRAPEADSTTLSVPQVEALLRAAADGPRPQEVASWAVAVTLGLRQGERLGLRAGAVDLDAGLVTVEWALQRVTWRHGCGGTCGRKRGAECPQRHDGIPASHARVHLHGALYLVRPKSRAGSRVVPMPDVTRALLAEHLQRFGTGDHDLLFTTDGRHPLDPGVDSRLWHAALDRAGIPSVKLHVARHTAATVLEENDVPEHTRLSIFGHTSATTQRGYAHQTIEPARRGMGVWDRLLGS